MLRGHGGILGLPNWRPHSKPQAPLGQQRWAGLHRYPQSLDMSTPPSGRPCNSMVIHDGASAVSFGSHLLASMAQGKAGICSPINQKTAPPSQLPPVVLPVTQDGACAVSLGSHGLANKHTARVGMGLQTPSVIQDKAAPPSGPPSPVALASFKMVPVQEASGSHPRPTYLATQRVGVYSLLLVIQNTKTLPWVCSRQ